MLFILCKYKYFACVEADVPCVCLVPMETRRVCPDLPEVSFLFCFGFLFLFLRQGQGLMSHELLQLAWNSQCYACLWNAGVKTHATVPSRYRICELPVSAGN